MEAEAGASPALQLLLRCGQGRRHAGGMNSSAALPSACPPLAVMARSVASGSPTQRHAANDVKAVRWPAARAMANEWTHAPQPGDLH
jgi:hypothetical protein